MGRLAAALLALVVTLTGCKQAEYAQQTASFSDSVDKAVVGLRAMYTGINTADRQTYLVERLLNPAQPVGDVEACLAADGSVSSQQTLLVKPRFSESAINARVHLLELLGAYAKALAALASGSAPDDVATKMGDLQTAFVQVGKDAAVPANSLNSAGPLATIAGTLGKLYLERRRSAELTRIIHDADKPITDLLALLESDAGIAHLALLSSTDDDYATWTNYYNRVRETALPGPRKTVRLNTALQYCNGVVPTSPIPITMPKPGATLAPRPGTILIDPAQDAATFTVRSTVLDHVVAARDDYFAARAANPVAVVQSLRKSHQALVKFADAPDDIRTLADLQGAIAEFKGDAQTLYNAYTKLRSGSK
jgi:hypothetical protein